MENSLTLKKQEQVMFNSLSDGEQEELYVMLKRLLDDWNGRFVNKELEQ